jgi:hypothetical protein
VVKIIIKKPLKFWALHSFEYDDTTLYLFPLLRLQRKEKFKTGSNSNNHQQLITLFEIDL